MPLTNTLLKRNLLSSQIPNGQYSPEYYNTRVLTVKIRKNKIKPFLVTIWYRSPNPKIEKIKEFEKVSLQIDTEDKESMLIDDLLIDYLLIDDPKDNNTKELKFVTNGYPYSQLINEATRITKKTKTLIDHFYTNKPENIILSCVNKITISDHYLIYGIRKFPSLKGNTNLIEYRDVKNFNKNAFLNDIRSCSTINLRLYNDTN